MKTCHSADFAQGDVPCMRDEELIKLFPFPLIDRRDEFIHPLPHSLAPCDTPRNSRTFLREARCTWTWSIMPLIFHSSTLSNTIIGLLCSVIMKKLVKTERGSSCAYCIYIVRIPTLILKHVSTLKRGQKCIDGP